MRQRAVMFGTNGLKFEGVVAQPDDLTGSVPGVVICHPGPLNGGNMDNNVVVAVSVALVDEGLAAGFLGCERMPEIKTLLGIPDNVSPIGIVTVGHPAPDRKSGSLKRGRRPDTIHRERW